METRFYRDLASRLDLAVPRCYHADLDEDTGDFVLLLEDLTGASPGHPLQGCTFEQSLLLMHELGRLHGTWWNGAQLASMGWPRRTYDAPRLEKRLAEFRAQWGAFQKDRRYRVDEPLLQAVARVPDSQFMDAARQLAEPPVTLIHGDLHVENLLLDDRAGDLQAWIFDWQDVGIGHPARDFAYVLAGDTAVEVQRESGEALLRTYLAELRDRAAVDYDLANLLEDYAAAVRWEFLYQVLFLRQFEPETAHDLRTLQLEWERLASAFCACSTAER
jgi:aminoglycoside/choline kinase family phosphotransferase